MKNLKTNQLLPFGLLALMMCVLRFVMADVTTCGDRLVSGGMAEVGISVTGCAGGAGTWSDIGYRVACGHYYVTNAPLVMRSTSDIADVSGEAHVAKGSCDSNSNIVDQCYCGSTIIDLGTTGCKLRFITNDLCGGGHWKISEPRWTGVITVTATATGQCVEEGCDLQDITYTAIGTIQVDLPPDDSGGGGGSGGGGTDCGTCGTKSRSHGSGAVYTDSANRANLRLNFGLATPTLDAGCMLLNFPRPSTTLAQPTTNQVPFERPGVEVILLAGGSTVKQVKVPQGLVNVTGVNDYKYQLEVFSTNAVTGKDGGYYGTNAPAFVTWVLENPFGAADTNHLNITEKRGGTDRLFQYTYRPASNRWDLLQPDGQTTNSTWTVADTGNTNITNYFCEVSSGGQVLKETIKTYDYIPGLNDTLLEREVEGTGATARTNTYVYLSSDRANGASTNLLQRADYWDGKWAYYTYDSLGRVSTNYSTYGTNAPPNPGTQPYPNLCKVTEYAYSFDPDVDGIGDDSGLYLLTARRTIVKVPVAGAPQEISRTYHRVYDSTREEAQECPDPGATWGAAANLRMVTVKDDQGRVVSSLHQDGTATIYTYQDDYTTIEETGQPDDPSVPGSIVSGTQTTTVVDELGLLLSVTSLDITNSVVLASQVYNYKDSGGNYLDTLRRSYDVTDLAGRTAHYRYNDCCGLDYIDDREGIRTYYEYDPLMKRQIGTRTVVDVVGSLDRAIETTNRLDGLGRVLATMRVGTNGNVITQAQFQYDLLGQIIAQTNALNGRTAYTNLITSSGLTLKTNLFPDGGARVEIYNRDGQLAEVIGTAVQQVRYATDVGSNGNFYRRYTQEIKLHADGSDSSETNKTYLDGTGRACKTAYAPRPGVDSAAPSRQSFCNEYGQVWKESDPDGVITLYTYDGQGRQEYTIAVTDNSSVPTDYDALLSALGTLKGGSNRITQVQWSIVPTNGSKPDLVRQDTLVWDNGQSSGRLVSRSEASADGLHSWQTVYGDNSEAAITEALTQYGTGASRSVMTTAPDLSYTISAYSYGRLTSVTRYDSLNSQLSTLNY
ncbi:MAG: hypothetical protein WCI20_11200 [bacterium]